MWTGTIRSGTEEYPGPTDVYRALLAELVENNFQRGWAHFEYCKHPSNWLRRAFSGIMPWVEVAPADENQFELNLSLPAEAHRDPAAYCLSLGFKIPETWLPKKKWVYLVPTADQEHLVDWLDQYFLKGHGCPPDYVVQGYLDGL